MDMDAFFASVEQFRNHPEFIGQPLCVGPDPRTGRCRGVVRSASYEARAYGVRSGMSVTRAYQLCPEAVFIEGDFSDYVRASQEVMSVLMEFADGGHIRQASIDEAYLEVTESSERHGGPERTAHAIQREVKRRTLLPCSIGVAPNMSVAKIAASIKKPMGVTVVPQDPERVAEFLAPLPVDVIQGVGRKTAERLNRNGITTVGQIQTMSLTDLWPLMGRMSSWLHDRARGIDDRPLIERIHHRHSSIGKDRTLMEDIDPRDTECLLNVLRTICYSVAQRMTERALAFRTVTVKMRYNDFSTVQRSHSLPVPTQDPVALHETAVRLLKTYGAIRRPVRMLGIRVSALSEHSFQSRLTDFVQN